MRGAFSLAAGTLAVLIGAGRAEAHHGKDFLIVETDEVPHLGQAFLFSSQDYVRQDGAGSFLVSPSVLFGAFPIAALEVHAHLEKEPAAPWRYDATAVAARLRLTPEGRRLGVGFAAEYELGHGGTADRIEGRLIGAYHPGRANLTIDLVIAREHGPQGETSVGYALGFRPDVERRLSWGVEGQGDFDGGHEVLLGLYASPAERVTVKVGIGHGFRGGPGWTIRTGLVVRP
jgi:hypothetical protein